MSAILRASTVIGLLLVLLTWLLVHGLYPYDASHGRTVDELRQLSAAQASLYRNVLRARSGLLQDYDSLVEDVAALRQATTALAASNSAGGWGAAEIAILAAQVDREEAALELFKTDNALLQNSLSYFDVMSTRIGNSNADVQVRLAAGALTTSVLHLTRDPSSDVEVVVRTRATALQQLVANLTIQANTEADADTLTKHAQLLANLLPAVDEDLRAVLATSTAAIARTIRLQSEARHTAEARATDRSEVAIYLIAMVLIVALVRVGMLLRRAVQQQRRRAMLEHVITAVSVRFVAGLPDDSDGAMKEAMQALGAAFGASRAYLVLGDGALHLWRRPGEGAAQDDLTVAGWPGTALRLVPEAFAPGDDLVQVQSAGSLPPGPLRQALTDAGVEAWAAVALRRHDQFLGLFGLDWTGAAPSLTLDAGLLRLAGDVVCHAERRKMEQQERADLQRRLLRARRLEAVGTFASGIAHNFNNVIGAVLGHAEMAGDSLHGSAGAAHHVQEIHRAGKRAQELVGRILDFGTRGRSMKEVVLLDALVTETVSMLRASLPPEITLQVERGAAGGYVTAEPVQLQQVLLNLIRNAVQASPRGGQVTVRTAVQEVGAHRQLSHGELTPGHYVRAIVADTGEGMAASTLAQVFRPFFTTRPAGTGLGLATVREIVEDHGGIIDVRSVVDHGSIFEVWLPLAPPPTGDCAETPPGGGQTVLVLDSDPSVMLKDEEMLAALGYEPVGFTSADAALAACSAAPGRFDAMLIDAALLGRDVALPGALRRLARRCPIMLISSGTVGARPDLMARSGARVVLNRPLRGSTLATALVQSIEAGPRENVH